jgi:hypothetical protein
MERLPPGRAVTCDREARWRIVIRIQRRGQEILSFRQTATEVVGNWSGLLLQETAIKRVGRWSGSPSGQVVTCGREARWGIVSGFKRQGSQMLGFRQTATEVVGTWIGLLVHGTAIKRVGRWSGSHRAKWQLRWSWKQGGNRLQYQSLSTAGSTVLNSAKRQFRLSGHKSFLRFVDRWPKGSGGGAASCRTGRLLR